MAEITIIPAKNHADEIVRTAAYARVSSESEPIEGADEGIVLGDDDYNYLGENMTLDEFANPVPKMEQTM